MTRPEDDEMDELFGAARASTPAPSADFMARLRADAESAQPRRRPVVAMAQQPAMSGGGTLAMGGGFVGDIGGWPSLTFLGLAALTGLWFGLAAPGNLGEAMAALLGESVTLDIMPSAEVFEAEEF
ncbi:hypothetical protein ACXN5S_14790 [Pseudoroseicyclus sp. H15]